MRSFVASLLVLLIALPVHALDVTDNAGPTPRGEDGRDATAVAESGDPANRARALAGAAGIFFEGPRPAAGDAVAIATTNRVGALADAYAAGGGSGTVGGDATATASATSSGPGDADAVARAAGGSFGLSGGDALADAAATTTGSGDATATASSTAGGAFNHSNRGVSRATATADSGSADSTSSANGGGFTDNAGGILAAGILSEAVSRSAGASGSHSKATALATGGGVSGTAGSDGGTVTATASAYASAGADVSAKATAQGGESRSTGASDAAIATALGVGTAKVDVFAEAKAPLTFGIAGGVTARARGVSTVGNVKVTAREVAQRGDAGHMVDSVSGSTAGTLTLRQEVVAGHASASATNMLTALNEGGGALVVEVDAQAAEGQSGGDGADGADGGVAVLLANGSSTTGAAVSVSGVARSGDGGDAFAVFRSTTSGQAGAGGAAILDNAVTGSTSGALSLSQIAIAGDGGRADVGNRSGDGGDALSRIVHATDSSSLSIIAEAESGKGGGMAGNGGAAVVDVSVENSGDIGIDVSATGGDGGSATSNSFVQPSPLVAGKAGTAVAKVSALSTGDGSVRVGSVAGVSATGGRGESWGADVPGNGGEATSESHGEVRGAGDVLVFDRALGGNARGLGPSGAVQGDGGAASSTAGAVTAGSGSADSVAFARGGDALGTGTGGAASALARGESTGGGYASATARQEAGVSGGDGVDSIARDLVSGSTTGQLFLWQIDRGGDSRNGDGGDSLSSLAAATAGDLTTLVLGQGGGTTNGTAGSATIDKIDLKSGGDVGLQLTATGGTLLPLTGGRGGDAIVAGDAFLIDAPGDVVVGVTANGGSGIVTALSDGGGGNALVDFALDVDAASLKTTASASGGNASGTSTTGFVPAGIDAAGNSSIALELVNRSGGIDATNASSGGRGAAVADLAVAGGSSSIDIRAETFGDGADIRLRNAGSTGGEGAGVILNATPAAKGGDAINSTHAVAHGNSSITILDDARGGLGGIGGLGASAGAGGDAHTSATAVGHGSGSILIRTTAIAGTGGRSLAPSGQSGDGGASGNASLGIVSGVSHGGGDVSVDGTARTAGSAAGTNGGVAGAGSEIHLNNNVTGATTGSLTLQQTAFSTAASSSKLDHKGDLAALSLNADATSLINQSVAEARGENTSGSVSVYARATRVTAVGVGHGEAAVDVVATALLDAASGGGIDEARGVSYGGGDVSVSGTVAGGTGTAAGGIELAVRNGIDGSTSGGLKLYQLAMRTLTPTTLGAPASATSQLELVKSAREFEAFAHAQGGRRVALPLGSLGGDADAFVDASNLTGSVIARALAEGGASLGADAGGARASAIGRGVASYDVTVSAEAIGGDAFTNHAGGSASLGEVYGSSEDAGRVDVSGIVRMGGQASELVTPVNSAVLIDAVDGDTAGELSLFQSAIASGSSAGDGASAYSQLTRHKDLASLSLRSESRGGDAPLDLRTASKNGGVAETHVTGSNAHGFTEVAGFAIGGKASTGGAGGDAMLRLHAESISGDVLVGEHRAFEDAPTATNGAIGGDSRLVQGRSTGLIGRDGGAASSASGGISYEGRRVGVYDVAVGGSAFGLEPIGLPLPLSVGRGGNADSSATATAYEGEARADSYAEGGAGATDFIRDWVTRTFQIVGGRVGGDAAAHAEATGVDEVFSTATAIGGRSHDVIGATAAAVSTAHGEDGLARARAETSWANLQSLSVAASAELYDGSVSVEAAVSSGGALAAPSGGDVSIRAMGNVIGADKDALLSTRPGLAADLANLGLDTVLAHAEIDINAGEGVGTRVVTSLHLTPEAFDGNGLENLSLFLLDGKAESERGAFEKLIVRVMSQNVVLLDKTIRRMSAVEDYFNGRVFNFGEGFDSGGTATSPGITAPIYIELAWFSKSAGWSFDGDIVIAAAMVPEPGTGILVCVGLLGIALRRRTATQRA